MDVVVAGAGALGCFYGGLLARQGHNVTFLARGATLDALNQEGLMVRSRIVGNFHIDVRAVDSLAETSVPELLFFSVKSFDLDSMAERVKPIAGPETVVVAVQNGIDHPQRLRLHLAEAIISPTIVYVSATIESPGVVVQPGGPGQVRLGLQNPVQHSSLVPIREALLEVGIPSEILEDYRQPMWEKFMVICAMSGVAALTRLTLKEIFAVPESRQLYYEVMAEVAAVARATGVDLPTTAAEKALAQLLEMDALPLRGSMAYDLEVGKHLELSTLNGTVTRLGAQLGVPVPMNRAIYLALKPFEAGAERNQG